jgi:hypothetical protein
MFYTIYKTTNLLNGKYYIGAHKTTNLEDSYLGSGVALKRAVAKYGEQNFKKEILFIFDNAVDMYNKESELVEVSDKTYNMMEGGKGGWDHVDNWGDKNPMKRKEVVDKVFRNRVLGDKFYSACTDNLKAATESNIGRKRPEHSRLMKEKSHLKKMMEENYDEWRKSLGASTYELTSPSGDSIITDRLKDVCKEQGISYTTMYNVVKTGIAPKRGKSKGWNCKKL